MSNDHFSRRADEFIAMVRAANLKASTEVNLCYHCVDEYGNPVAVFKIPLTPTITLHGMGNSPAARAFVASEYRNTIVLNINSLVRGTPNHPIRIDGGPCFPVTVKDYSLDIIQPDE